LIYLRAIQLEKDSINEGKMFRIICYYDHKNKQYNEFLKFKKSRRLILSDDIFSVSFIDYPQIIKFWKIIIFLISHWYFMDYWTKKYSKLSFDDIWFMLEDDKMINTFQMKNDYDFWFNKWIFQQIFLFYVNILFLEIIYSIYILKYLTDSLQMQVF
jgi:hypothetical protein